jgi:hypothetical protein
MVYVWYPTASDQKTDEGIYQSRAREIDAAPGADRFRQSPVRPSIVAGQPTRRQRDCAR